jgi:N-acetylglucosamine-6-phosphate deacetylase
MNRMQIKNDKIILPNGIWSGCVTIKDGRIAALSDTPSAGECIDATGLYVAAGFIDMHVHGGGGHDFMDGCPEAFRQAALAHLRHGTTTLVPTSLACEMNELYRFIDNFHTARKNLPFGPCLWGVHLEGPYLSATQAGAQDPRYIKNPDPDEYKSIIEYARGAVVRWSVAPELPGASAMGDYLHERGIIPAIAHSDAEYDDILAARTHHYRLITHLYSGMSSIVRKNGYRRLGVTESAYLLDDLDVEIIADGHHLPAALLQLIVKGIGVSRMALVTDAMRAAACVDGEYTLGSLRNGRRVIAEGGVAKLPDRSAFAGSVATADTLVRVMRKQAGVSVEDAVRMVTANPARMMNIPEKGRIAVGMDADLVLFDDEINISTVIAGGYVH